MNLGLEGKVALVCAASKGLGRACAVALAAEGAHVAICARDAAGIGEAGEAIAAVNGTGALGLVADVGDPGDLDTFVAETTDQFGRSPDIVVWNAGGPPPGPLLSLSADDLDQGIRLHLHGAMHLLRRVVPPMVDRGWGRVIAITSLTVRQPLPGLGISNGVRAGLTGLLKTLAEEVGRHGVTVNTVQPGFTLTDRLRSLAAAKGIDPQDFAKNVPAGRVGLPEELAAAVAFLASEPAAYINGVSLPVDGGFCRGLQ